MSHEALYQNLRACLLERRFVTALRHRVCMYSGGAILELPTDRFRVDPQPGTDAWKALTEAQQQAAMRAPIERYQALPAHLREEARWVDEDTHEENPWLHFAPMVIALSVEQRLGHAHARAVLDSLLTSLACMFPFGGAFSGYPIRWDAAFSPIGKRHWFDHETRSRVTEFLLTPAGAYGFANRPSDFRQHHRRTSGRLAHLMLHNDPDSVKAEVERYYYFKRHARQWEPSQDEVFGILATLWAIATIATDAGLRARAQGLMARLADYLSRHAYLLVKPEGGLVSRGHGDSLVGAEFAINEAFASVLGRTFPAQAGPDGAWALAMSAAGHWEQLRGLQAAGAVAGTLFGWAANLLATVPLAASLILHAPRPAIGVARAHPAFGLHIGKMLAVMARSEVFDPWSEDFRGEPAQSMYFHEHRDTRFRYELYCDLIHGARVDWPVNGFMPFHSLFGLDRPDDLLRRRYLIWFDDRRDRPTAATPLFSLAMACLLAGDGRYEQDLADALDTARVAYRTAHGDDLALESGPHDAVGNAFTVFEQPQPAIDYMAALALAWLHAQRRGPVNTVVGFPAPPATFSGWRRPRSRPEGPQRARVDLYPNDIAPPRDAPRPPDIEPAPDTALPPQEVQAFTVAPNVREVDTLIDIHFGDVFSIEGSGTVQVFGAPVARIPPAGVAWPAPLDPDWPVHAGMDPGARQYALAARLNGWFMVGAGIGPRRWFATHWPDPAAATRRLYLRVNQPTPQAAFWGGAFQALVRVWRFDPGPSPIAFDQLAAYDFSWFPPRIDIGYRWASPGPGIAPPLPRARLWIQVRQDGGPWALLQGANLPVAGFIGGPIGGVELDPAVSSRHVVAWEGDTAAGPMGHRNGVFDFRVTLMVGNLPLTEVISREIRWHGERIQCVRRPQRGGPTGLLGIGGLMPSGRRWTLTLAQAIEEIDRGQPFYVEEPVGDRVPVVVDRRSRPRPFLHTVADGDRPNNLLSLPSCP